jgi:hypothetical protein
MTTIQNYHECKRCGVECTLKDGFKWFREDDTYECQTCFDNDDYEELCQQLNYYFSRQAIVRWFTENLPEKEWLEEIAIEFVHELEGDADTDTDENDEMTQLEYREWNRENPEIAALGRQVETLEAERAKLIAYIKEQQEHIRVLGAQYEADNGRLATADWDTILGSSDDTNSGEAPAATQPIPIPAERK